MAVYNDLEQMEAVEGWGGLVSRVSFSAGVSMWKPTLSVAPHPVHGASIRLSLMVPDRDGGGLTRVVNFHHVVGDPREGLLVSVIFDMLSHEIRESVRLDGELVRDPHEDEVYR